MFHRIVDGMPQGEIEIFWEWKEEGHFCVSVNVPEETKRLPLEIRRHIVTRFREVMIPARTDRRIEK